MYLTQPYYLLIDFQCHQLLTIPKPKFPVTILSVKELLLPLILNPFIEFPETVFPESELALEIFNEIPEAKIS